MLDFFIVVLSPPFARRAVERSGTARQLTAVSWQAMIEMAGNSRKYWLMAGNGWEPVEGI